MVLFKRPTGQKTTIEAAIKELFQEAVPTGGKDLASRCNGGRKSATGRMSTDWQNKVPGAAETERFKRLALIVYALQAASIPTGSLTLVAGVIINYVRRDDVQGTWLESHFRWQIRTFWYTLLWMLIGGVTMIFLVGYLILTAATLWLIYRTVRGWLYLSEGRTMPA